MNTKKAVWIGRPEKMRMTLHSIAFRSEDAHSVLFVLGEAGEMSISYASEAKAALTLLHTPNEYIVFGEERIVISFKGVRTEIPHAPIRSLKLVKEGKLRPELIIAVPVGFVNVVPSKELILSLDVPSIVARGRKGGSNIAACICNALLYHM